MDWLKVNVTKYDTAGTSTAGTWPAHSSGDLLLAVYLGENNNNDFSDASNTSVGSAAASGGGSANTIAVYRRTATTSSETDPSATHASATNRACIAIAIDSSVVHGTPIDTSGFASLNTNTSPYDALFPTTGTTGADNVAAFYFTISDQGVSLGLDPGPQQFVNEYIEDGSCEIAASYVFLKSSGSAFPSFRWGMMESINNGFVVRVPVRMSTDLPRVDHANPPCDWIYSAAYRNTTGTAGYQPYTFENIAATVSTVAGLTTVNGSATSAPGVGVNPFNALAGMITGTNDRLGIVGATFSTMDCSGSKILFQPTAVQGLFSSRTNLADDHGMVVSLKSSTNEYRWFDAGGKDTRPHELKPVIVDSTSTGIHDENTLDFTDITGVGMGMYRDSAEVRIALDKGWKLNDCPILGGDSGTPSSWQTAYDNLQGIDCGSIQKLGNAFETGHDIKIGPGVYFATGGQTLSGMPDATSTDKRFQASSTSLDLHGVSGDTIKINDLVAGLDFIINASATSAATWDFNGGTLNDIKSWTVGADIGAISGLNIFNSVEIDLSSLSADFDLSGGCTITNGSETYDVRVSGATAAAIQAKLDLIANCTIGDLIIDSTFAGDIAVSFDNITATTCHYKSSQAGSTCTATMQNSSTVGSTSVEDDETLTISNEKTLSLVIQDESGSSVTGAEVGLMQRGTTTEVDHDNNTASGTYSYTYTYSSDVNLDIQVFKEGYETFWDDTQALINSDQSFTVVLRSVSASQN